MSPRRFVSGLLGLAWIFSLVNFFGPVSRWLLAAGIPDLWATIGAFALIFAAVAALGQVVMSRL